MQLKCFNIRYESHSLLLLLSSVPLSPRFLSSPSSTHSHRPFTLRATIHHIYAITLLPQKSSKLPLRPRNVEFLTPNSSGSLPARHVLVSPSKHTAQKSHEHIVLSFSSPLTTIVPCAECSMEKRGCSLPFVYRSHPSSGHINLVVL